MKFYLFIGRYQPLHEGHIKLIRTVLDKGDGVLIGLRKTSISEKNPHSMKERTDMFEAIFKSEIANGKVLVMPLPVDIAGICYGRGVGYEIREIRLSEETEAISGTAIRAEL